MSRRHYRRHRRCWRSSYVSISDRRLYRDPARGRIAGVCAGLADYFSVSTTMTRFVAVTALIFVPQVTFIAYLIAAFMLPTRKQIAAENQEGADNANIEREHERQREFERKLRDTDADTSLDDRRRLVRQARERLRRIEGRIRHLEAYVTSRRYDLNREFGDLR